MLPSATRTMPTPLYFYIISLLLTLGVISSSRATNELSIEQHTSIDNIIQHAIKQSGRPSIAVIIDRGGETLYASAFGKSNLEYNIAATIDQPYAIGSITKSFTALATLQLVEQGKIDLEAPVSAYLADYKGPARSVKVSMLLNHTSGIPNYANEFPTKRDSLSRDGFTRDSLKAIFEHEPLKFTPGSKFEYTNSGYYLLGLIIEQVSGQNYYDYIQQHIFDPLGMSNSSSGDDKNIVSNRAAGYTVGQNGYLNAPSWSHLVPFSAGSLISTAGDLVKYRRGVAHSDVFSSALRQLILRTVPMTDGTPAIYALGGLIVGQFEGHRKTSHGGDIWGYSATHAYYPDDDVTIVLLSNLQTEAPAAASIELKIARVVFNLPPLNTQDLTLTDKALTQYAGDYRLHPFIFGVPQYGFLVKDQRLHIVFGGLASGGQPIPLLAQGNHRFSTSFDDEWVFDFQKDANNAVVSLKARYLDGVFYANRE